LIPREIPLIGYRTEILDRLARALEELPQSSAGGLRLAVAGFGLDLAEADIAIVDVVMLFPPPRSRSLPIPQSVDRILVVGIRSDGDSVLAAFGEGVHVHLLEDLKADTLAQLIGTSAKPCDLYEQAGRLWAHRVRSLLATRVEQTALTRQETAVVALMRDGLSNPEIAMALRIETKTVKNHTTSILRKLGVRSRYEVIASARGRVQGM
jgi:DNA-binding NarL/FixJ family response regulator